MASGGPQYNRQTMSAQASNEVLNTPSSSKQSNLNLSTLNIKPDTISVNLTLDCTTHAWLNNHLRRYWTILKKSTVVTNMLREHFDQCNNPYEEALRLMYNCLDFKDAKPKSLAFLIMDEFGKWKKVYPNKDIQQYLTIHIKVSAFNIVKQQRSYELLKLVGSIYELTADCDIFLECIKSMISEKQYKEACQCAILLNLHGHFGVEAFIVPLLLQDKLSSVDEFLKQSPKHAIELVKLLDSMLGQHSTIHALVESYVSDFQIPEVKWNKVQSKPWRKLITRFVKMFDIPPEVTPNLNLKRNEGALQFLIHKRYTDNGFGEDSWKEMVQEAVQDDRHLQIELIRMVATYGDFEEALYWSRYYAVERCNWPHTLRSYHDNPNENKQQWHTSTTTKDSDNSDKKPIRYHQLALPITSVHLVDNIKCFEIFLSELENTNMVGMDCEWKPSFGLNNSELSVLQIATRHSVFILDVITIGSRFQHLWKALNDILFCNCDILKLGFNFGVDVSMIMQALPYLDFTAVGFLDLSSLWRHLDKGNKIVYPYSGAKGGGSSLNTLVQLCLGKPLDKSDQFSNWENRPLRNSQLVYAALDAYCLLEVYDVLKRCSKEPESSFNDICFQLISSYPKKKVKKPTRPKTDEKAIRMHVNPSPHIDQVPASAVKLVCDNMLESLGKLLRYCGIDTAILESSEDHKKCVQLALDENRFILTRGSTYDQLAGLVPIGHCLSMVSDIVEEQLKQVVDYYMIIVTKKDMCSRCQICNNNLFINATQATMRALSSNMNSKANAHKLVNQATNSLCEDKYELPCSSVKNTQTRTSSCDKEIDFDSGCTKQGAIIKIRDVPQRLLRKKQIFYICQYCGMVYWDGSHLDSILPGKLQGIIKS